MSWKSVVILTFFYAAIVCSQHIDGYDDGFWPNCLPGLLDMTFTKDETDGLKLLIVLPGNKPFKTFPISRALEILKDKDFNISRRTMLFAHGYGDLPASNDHPVLKTYLEKPEYNVLLLNSMSMIADIGYMRSARAVRYVGARLGPVLAQMTRAGLTFDTLELIGHSLGAHIVGFTGKLFYKTTGKKLLSIVGLDPAGPCFRQAEPDNRLDKSDGVFVQVIHSNDGSFGLVNAIGHVDFYVNGGRWQPSEVGVGCLIICSHNRPMYLWQAAMTAPEGRGFIGVECPSVDFADQSNCYREGNQRTAVLGPKADPKINGIFYVRTSSNYPFYLGKRGTKRIKTSP